MITVFLNERQQTFEVDTGAKFSLLSETEFNKLNLQILLQHSNLVFRSYTGNVFKPLGKLSIQVQYKNKTMTGDLHIVPDGHATLLGRQWIRGLEIKLNDIDNDTSDQFHTYCTHRGIFQKYIAPGHPATNGLAERNIQTLKNKLKTLDIDVHSTSLQVKLQEILLRYRATPLACGKTPAQLYLNRNIRIRLDAVFPYQLKPTSNKSESVRSFKEGERVQARLFVQNKCIWKFGTVSKCLGTRHYLIKLDTGRSIKRHINQLQGTMVPVPKESVKFGQHQSKVPRLPEPHQVIARTPEGLQNNAERSPRPDRSRHPPTRYRDYVLY